MEWQYDDGGRAAAGYRGQTGDCVTRAIAIAMQRPYEEVYRFIADVAANERPRTGRRRSSPRSGVHKRTIKGIMDLLGWRWVPTMGIGTGCLVHLRADELPPGRLVVSVSKHLVAVVDGVVHDTHDPSRLGQRCVYGYWQQGGEYGQRTTDREGVAGSHEAHPHSRE